MQIVKALLFTLSFLYCYLANTQTLVKDINDALIGSRPQLLTESSDYLYFIANSPEYGTELFRTNEEGTELVKDFYKGSTAFKNLYNFDNHLLAFLSKPERNTIELWKIDHDSKEATFLKTFGFTNGGIIVGEEFYFVASNRNGEEQLWKTDGTVSGTIKIKSFSRNSSPYVITEYKGDAYFVVTEEEYGRELWKTDGTEEGTVLIKDINPDGDANIGKLVKFKDKLFFRATDVLHGAEFWCTDGTADGTQLVKDTYPGTGYGYPQQLFAAKDYIYFAATVEGSGQELWISDGTMSGTYLLKDINGAINSGSSPAGFIEMNDIVYFRAGGLYGYNLWRTDGTSIGTHIVKDGGLDGRVIRFDPKNRVVKNGLLYFRVDKGREQYSYLWRTDGTSEGTFEIPINSSAHLSDLTGFNNSIFFSAKDSENGTELWSYHTLTQIASIQSNLNNEHTLSADIPPFFAQANNKLFFFAKTKEHGIELWTVDLETNETQIVKDIRIGESSAYYWSSSRKMIAFNENYVLFPAYDNSGVSTLWKSDGTAINTIPIMQLYNTSDFQFQTHLTKLENEVLFVAGTSGSSKELWKTDGTLEGTALVKNFNPSGYANIGLESILLNGVAFFAATDGIHGMELWKSDGTTEGTVMVADINREGNFNPKNFMILGDELYFTAYTPNLGNELWKYDDSTQKIELVKDIRRGQNGSEARPVFQLKGEIYLFADDGTHGGELWKTDGTSEGTILVKDIYPGRQGGMRGFQANSYANEKVAFFRAYAPRSGDELWVTDGTEEGTKLLKDLAPGNLWSSPYSITPYDNQNIIFGANSGGAGTSQAFITDGTEENTFAILDKAPFIGRPTSFTITGEKMYFIAGNEVIGRELFQMPIEICEREEMTFNELTEGGIYKALDRVKLSKKTADNSSVVVKAGYEVVLEEGFETADDGWLTINIEECIEEEESQDESIEERSDEIISNNNFSLNIAPNPFTNLTNIQYQIPERGEVNLLLFNAQGQLIRSISKGQMLEAGIYSANLNANDLEAGLYFLILQTATEKVVEKLVVVK